MDIVFVTTIRPRENSHDFDKLITLLNDTIGSLYQIENCNKHVVVVSNEPLSIAPRYDGFVSNIILNTPITDKGKGAHLGFKESKLDAGSKRIVGILHAQTLSPRHIMLVDQDDFLSKDIYREIQAQSDKDCITIENGYLYKSGSRNIAPQKDFYRYCGTSHVMSATFLAAHIKSVPIDPVCQLEIETLLSLCSADVFEHIICKHRQVNEQTLALHGTTGFIAAPVAIWHLETGENRSGQKLDTLSSYLTNEMAEKFGLPEVKSGYWQYVMNNLSALLHRALRVLRK